ncbi:S41 family peptidase [Colwelliaceae bacterium MEBiC 14330]
MLAWKTVIINLVMLVLVACVNQEPENNEDLLDGIEISCGTQLEKNESLWRVLTRRYLWNDALDQTTNLSDFDSLSALINDVKQKNPQDRYSSVQLPNAGSLSDAIENGTMTDNGLILTFSHDRQAVIAKFVWPKSSANELGIKRGNKIISISGVSIADLLVAESEPQNTIIDLLYASKEVAIRWQDHNDEEYQGVLTRRRFELETVFHSEVINTELGKVGYLVFSMFLPKSVAELNAVFEQFVDDEVEHLIIDLRVNGGGCCLDGQIESQIAGDYVIGKLAGRIFFNDNLSDGNSENYFALNNSIPAFNMDSVTFLTSKDTASASEGLISALSPYIDVKMVGDNTYGKTAGQGIYQICGETVYITEVTAENANGERIPSEGLSPTCYVEDNVKPLWGDPSDSVLAEALYLYQNGHCSN